MIENRLIIIDGNSLINRAFYALPPLTTKEGLHTNAVYGFVTMLVKILEDYSPEYISVAFDKKKPTFRHKQYDQYKAGRKKMPSELAEQIEPLKKLLDKIGISRIELEGFEADDLIGTIAKDAEQHEKEVLIVTGDRDALQLTSDRIKVLLTKKGISQLEIYDRKRIIDEYEVTPDQLIEVKGLMGDQSDNIPGVPGVGEKTALKLIREYSSINNLIQNIQNISAPKLKEKLETYTEQAVLSKKLGTIMTNVPIDYELDGLKRAYGDSKQIISCFNDFNFTSLVNKVHILANNKIEIVEQESKEEVEIQNITQMKKLYNKILENKKVAVKSLTEGINLVTDQIIAIALDINDGKQYFVDFRELDKENRNEILNCLKDLLEDEMILKITHDVKNETINFLSQNINVKNFGFDIMIAEYLIDPSKAEYGLKSLVLKYLSINITDEEELVGKGKNRVKLSELSKDKLKGFLCGQVDFINQLEGKLKLELESMDLNSLYFNVELPLTKVLANMQLTGIKVDKNMLTSLEKEYDLLIKDLKDKIYNLAEETFNINSPKQLGEVLFNKLGLPVIKKTKTGFSTNVDVLEKLKDKHEIIPSILEYRQISKVKSTYITGLLNIINPKTNRIHSNFNQTVTTTGRISSTEPNMQNIPIKLEMGRRIRKVFVASPEYKLIDADYSQIELRVLAHISQDKNLLEAFEKGQDIHTRTASEIFGVSMEDVTSAMRSDAKAVNFGIVYGISDFGLSENLKISRKKAKEYIENYLDRYPSVKAYMEQTIRLAKEKGYVTTILNRRRYLPEVNSKNFNLRSFGERMAMNTPIQGSAADIIKIAMIKVYNKLEQQKLKAKLLLQVHDELIIECPTEEAEIVSKIVRESMEEAMDLDIKLSVDLSVGDSWYDTK
ncbi:DNA polymerase I [Serpentinicella sp. ANB-PHB4]|uniref:DNA polymerase I n=1 Tax=Serpentinicella sp. ANB-PHB4 TaxID=3074076 RepID=UPI00285AA023|nr:DNA polymerase I [Serpentinicella sp. ANB-PHB4]MDR5657948.1 DNA polymerase I [Serpentinicella sp. ANB-PHB4]